MLDEAQLVANTSSVAAHVASSLWRRHAWVVTGAWGVCGWVWVPPEGFVVRLLVIMQFIRSLCVNGAMHNWSWLRGG